MVLIVSFDPVKKV